ncbi:MAG TPA: O-antigen ligase family protein [Chitinophagaceae bacterium]
MNKLFFVLVLFFAISLPLPIAFSSIAVILLCILFLANRKGLVTGIKLYAGNRRNILLLIIFATLTLSITYSDDKKIAANVILAALPLIALPLSLSRLITLTTRQYNILKVFFVLSCFITSLVYFFAAISRSGLADGSYPLYMRHMPLSDTLAYTAIHLTYHHLSPGIHAVFFSLYIAFAIILIVFNWEQLSKWAKIICGVLVFYFILYLILLSSIIINFGLFSFLIGYIYFQFSFRKWHHYPIFFLTLLSGTFITLYLLISKSFIPPHVAIYRFDSPVFNETIAAALILVFLTGLLSIAIKRLFKKNYVPILASLVILVALSFSYLGYDKYKLATAQNKNSIEARINYGKEALRAIKTNPVFGIGIGDKKNENIMKVEDLPEGALPDHMFNSHNQFLDFWLSSGIITLICFVLLLINELRKTFHYKDLSYLGLVYLFCLFCFTDSAIMVQRGQLFFLFFIALFDYEIKNQGKAT